MVKVSATIDSICLEYIKAGRAMIYSAWKDDPEASIYADIVNEFADNGQAFIHELGCELSYDAVYNLSTYERNVLSIPELYPYTIYVQPKGLLRDSSFQYVVAFRESKLGRRFNVKRQGAIIDTGSQKYLLNRYQFELVEAIDEYNQLSFENKSLNGNLIEFSRLKDLSQKAKAVLDKYLQSEDVYVPAKLKIEIEKCGEDCYELVPSVDSSYSDQFVRYLESRIEVPDNIAVSDDHNNRTRIVIDEEKQKIIREIRKKYRGVSARKLKEVVDNPALFLDVDHCDISEFYSDRVIEIGLYKPKVYPFVSPYKSSWIPSYTVEDRVNGTSQISFETLEEVDEFEKVLDRASTQGESAVSFRDTMINVEDGYQIVKDALKKLEEHELKEKREKKVLIVEENAESLGYSVDTRNAIEEGKYIFHSIPGLKPEIKLKKHQIEGVAWLQSLIAAKNKGCLLADDMGLGKTLQLLSLIDWYDKNYPNNQNPYLIVAPVSLIENWQQEYEKFFADPRIPVCSLTGSILSRHFGKGIDKSLIAYLQKRQIIITNYETIRSFQFSFCAVNYSLIILDEAQKIKTPGALVTNAAKALKGEFKVAMTGTPVENTLVDLWCIMDFSLPGLLGNCREFAHKYQTPLKSADTDIVELGNSVRKEMGAFFLRRLKQDVAKDLPTKNIRRIPVEMPEVQRKRYNQAIATAQQEKDKFSKEPGYMLKCIMQLREISDHPFLEEDWASYSIEDLINSSAKMKATTPLLDEIKSKNEKVILFAERRETQNILKRLVKFRYQIDSHIINGDTPTMQNERFRNGKMSRQQAIDDFQKRNGFNVIIMSPLAAGMGLNVVGANHVVHYSRHWNPAKEEQATDRVYRIGQTKDVFVYYPMAVIDGMTCFDQTLDALLAQKSQLAEATLFPTVRIEVNSEELFNKLFV